MPKKKLNKNKNGGESIDETKENHSDRPENYDDINSLNSLKLKQSKILGRYFVAAKPLKAGEIVLKDQAVVVGPCQESQPLCIGCYVNIDLKDSSSYRRCQNCGWPLCKIDCSGWHQPLGHSKEECDCLSESLIKFQDISNFVDYYYALTPLRCLLLKNTDKKKWNLLKSMETHTDKRKETVCLWETNQKMAVNVIRKQWGLVHFEEDEIHFVCGVLEVNAFEINNYISQRTQYLRALYSKSFLFAHDCVPNTCRSNDEKFQVIFHTIRTVHKNEVVSISYTYTLQSTLKRREHLKKTKFFSCSCKRCSDPTELGTYVGAMKCEKCMRGMLLPSEPLNEKSFWLCNFSKCQNKMKISLIKPLLEKFFCELDSISGNDVDGYENFLKKCQKVFHENHFLCLSAMDCLSHLYGKIEGYLINDLSNELLERKIHICKKLISVYERLLPGLSKENGILYYELHAPLMIKLRREHETKSITPKKTKSQLLEILNYLEKTRLILSIVPEKSDEGQMSQAANEAIKTLKASLGSN